MSVRLPDDYDPCDVYPLMVYIDGLDAQVGGQCGRMDIAQEILGKRGWVIASFPLFKKSLNPKEHRGGKLVGFEDYPTISKAYRVMENISEFAGWYYRGNRCREQGSCAASEQTSAVQGYCSRSLHTNRLPAVAGRGWDGYSFVLSWERTRTFKFTTSAYRL
jgi:hypothetical protein